MRLGVLFSGGKDSTLAMYVAKNNGYEISCLITIVSENPDSFMFHTPSISKVGMQAKAMDIPLITKTTRGVKERELSELEGSIKEAIRRYAIEGIVTGAVESVYQASRVQKICNKLGIECFNPLWQKDQYEILDYIIKYTFEVIITGVAAYPLGKEWLGKKIDRNFIRQIKKLEKYRINPAGEGGEFETFVLGCPLFRKPLSVKDKKITGSGNSFRMEVDVR